jgi:hypothetical protein
VAEDLFKRQYVQCLVILLGKVYSVFSVEDETGVVDASYAALCQMGPVMLKDGDQVMIEGHFLGTLDVRLVTKR